MPVALNTSEVLVAGHSSFSSAFDAPSMQASWLRYDAEDAKNVQRCEAGKFDDCLAQAVA